MCPASADATVFACQMPVCGSKFVAKESSSGVAPVSSATPGVSSASPITPAWHASIATTIRR